MAKVVSNPGKENLSWDMSNERAFMENLLNQRFNFFIVFYSLVIGGLINAKNTIQLQIILILGSVIGILIATTIFRAGVRLTLIMEELYKDSRHPVTVIRKRAGGPSVRWIISYAIPILCCLSLLMALTAALFGTIDGKPIANILLERHASVDRIE